MTGNLRLIHDLLPEGRAPRDALLDEARRLLALLDSEGRTAPPPDLATAQTALHRRLSAFPLADMLAHPPLPSQPRAAQIDRLRAWMLTAVLDAIACGDGAQTTKDHACATVSRLCRLPGLDAIRLRVPNLPVDHARSALQAVQRWQHAERAAGSGFAPRLYHVELTLAQLAGQQRLIHGPASRPRRDHNRHHIGAIEQWAKVPARDDLALMHRCDAFDLDGELLETVEEAGDIATLSAMRMEAPETGLSSAQTETEALMQAETELFAHNGAISAATHRLTAPEARQLHAALRAVICNGIAPAGVVMLAVSLLTGRTIADLCTLPRAAPTRPGRSWWSAQPVPKPLGIGFCPAVSGAPKPPANGLVMALPRWLQASVRDSIGIAPGQAVAEARAWLSSHNPAARRLRPSHVAGALPTALAASDTDAALQALLLGANIRIAPQLWYSRVSIEALHRAWCDAARGWMGEEDPQLAVVKSGRAIAIGSRRVPTEAQIAAFFAARCDALDIARTGAWHSRPGGVEQAHGAFIDQCAAILLAATGRRPHGALWPPLSHAMQDGPWPQIRIRDKGNRLVDDARWLPLPPVACEALAAMTAHLHHLRDWGRVMNPDVANAAKAALDGDGPLFWSLPDGPAAPAPLSCAAWWAKVLPAGSERNLFRHFWRSRFLADGLPSWMIDQWMGHGGWSGAQFLPMGASSAADLTPLRDRIEPLLRAFGARAPQAERLLP